MIFAPPKNLIVELITIEEKSIGGLILPKKEEHLVGRVLSVGEGCSNAFDAKSPCYVYFGLYVGRKIPHQGKDYYSIPQDAVFGIGEEL